jgi:hypothetical protein
MALHVMCTVFSFKFDSDNYQTIGARHVKFGMEIFHNIHTDYVWICFFFHNYEHGDDENLWSYATEI